jgi:hypothetical protein
VLSASYGLPVPSWTGNYGLGLGIEGVAAGRNFAEIINSSDFVAQTLATTPGQVYQVSFAVSDVSRHHLLAGFRPVAHGAERLQGSGHVKAGQQPGGGQSAATSRADFIGGVMEKIFQKSLSACRQRQSCGRWEPQKRPFHNVGESVLKGGNFTTLIHKLLIMNGAGEGNRTLVCSLEGCRSTIELRPLPPRIIPPALALSIRPR